MEGNVTYKGEPVPAGQVRFEPDRSQGGTGPVGFANIVDGKYSTREFDKGPVAGPVRVSIEGVKSAEPFAPLLFPPYHTTVDLEDDKWDLDFEVPVQAKSKSKRQ